MMADPTNPSRRLFLAAGPAAAVFTALRSEAAPAPAPLSPLTILIEAHKIAWREFSEIVGTDGNLSSDDPRYLNVHAEWNRLSDAESDAWFALCEYRPQNMQEVHQGGDYLAAFETRDEFLVEQYVSLIESFRS